MFLGKPYRRNAMIKISAPTPIEIEAVLVGMRDGTGAFSRWVKLDDAHRLYGAILATIAGAVIFPMAGEPMFLGSLKGATALYMVHLLYTGRIGWIVGGPSEVRVGGAVP